jgi:hypothetical protein
MLKVSEVKACGCIYDGWRAACVQSDAQTVPHVGFLHADRTGVLRSSRFNLLRKCMQVTYEKRH